MNFISLHKYKKVLYVTFAFIFCISMSVFTFLHLIYAAENERDAIGATSTQFKVSKNNTYASTTSTGELNLQDVTNDIEPLTNNRSQEIAHSAPQRSKGLEKIGINTYRQQRFGYSFVSPKDWHISQIPSMSYARIENKDLNSKNSFTRSHSDPYFKIEIVTLPSKGLSLEEWVERQNTTSYPLPKIIEQKNIDVAGQPAIYQIEQFGKHISPVVFVLKDDSIHLINPSSGSEEFKDIIDEFISSFAFYE